MIYLSFDIEEFDMPKEYGYDIDFQRQIAISRQGLISILDVLKKPRTETTKPQYGGETQVKYLYRQAAHEYHRKNSAS